MNALLPLFLIWAANRNQSGVPAAPSMPAAPPPWPTPTSPPPMPAFKATNTPTPSADPGHSSTPLADLHNAKPPLPPAHAAEPAAIKAKANTPAAAAKARALSVFKSGLRAAAAAPTTSRAVADLQSILTARGIKVTRDGLYGPKTAAAWSKLAKSKGLPTTISRGGPKIAKVSTQTYEALSLPHIP